MEDRLIESNAAGMKTREDLVNAGLILEKRGKEPRIYYRINRRKIKKISTLLRIGPRR